MRQLQLYLMISPLAPAEIFLSLLAFSQIQHEGNALVSPSLQQCDADQHRHATAVFADVLLLERCADSGGGNFYQRLFVDLAPFGRRQIGPAQATRDEIAAAVSHDVEKGLVGLDDPTVKISDYDPDDVGVDQAPDLGLQPSGQFTDRCFRLFAFGDLELEVVD